MVEFLHRSWNSFSASLAGDYPKTSQRSQEMLGEVLKQHALSRPLCVLDLGCGNGQLYEHLRSTGSLARYVGVDFSTPLLAAARQAFHGDAGAEFVQDNVSLLGKVTGPFDFIIYSHVIEMLESPELSLRRARDLGEKILIRFSEPPDFDTVTVELREMPVGEDKTAPYICWKMSRDYYHLILANIGCKRVDIYQAEGDKDQIHVLHFS